MKYVRDPTTIGDDMKTYQSRPSFWYDLGRFRTFQHNTLVWCKTISSAQLAISTKTVIYYERFEITWHVDKLLPRSLERPAPVVFRAIY